MENPNDILVVNFEDDNNNDNKLEINNLESDLQNPLNSLKISMRNQIME
jgi:hypothetical protein